MLRPGIRIAVSLFVLVAVAHGMRLLFLAPLDLGAGSHPFWINLLGVLLPLVVAGLLLLEDRDRGRR